MEKTKEVLTGAKVETSVAAFEQQQNPESGCTGKVLVTISSRIHTNPGLKQWELDDFQKLSKG